MSQGLQETTPLDGHPGDYGISNFVSRHVKFRQLNPNKGVYAGVIAVI